MWRPEQDKAADRIVAVYTESLRCGVRPKVYTEEKTRELRVMAAEAGFAFKQGDLVLVKWSDSMVYFAKIKKIDQRRRKCAVVFDDKSQDEADFGQIHSGGFAACVSYTHTGPLTIHRTHCTHTARDTQLARLTHTRALVPVCLAPWRLGAVVTRRESGGALLELVNA